MITAQQQRTVGGPDLDHTASPDSDHATIWAHRYRRTLADIELKTRLEALRPATPAAPVCHDMPHHTFL